jgi:tRNA 5-methylaminomethyl-2-thiouridine biosynthesis bifunctional protein
VAAPVAGSAHGLPPGTAWAGQRCWRVLATDFGDGLGFLQAWSHWRRDAARPALLHVVACTPQPPALEAMRRAAADDPALLPLYDLLAGRWWGLVPGMHRLVLEDGRVQLTLCVGELRGLLGELDFAADAVVLGHAHHDLATLKAVARLCRRGAWLAAPDADAQLLPALRTCGFVAEPGAAAGTAPLAVCYDPAWTPRPDRASVQPPSSALVVGAGLAGAAVAASLAARGCAVTVLDAAPQPAAGASGLPAGLLAPHATPDDNLLSRLVRAGLRLTLQEAAQRLRVGEDWSPTGVLQRREDARALPDLGPFGHDWQQPRDDGALWHAHGGWIKPGALVRAWLAVPGVRWCGGHQVAALRREGSDWQALDVQGAVLGQAPVLVVAAALGSAALLPGALPLHAVRGQVSRGAARPGLPWPATPVNGQGHLLPAVPLDDGPAWLCGATYGRGETATDLRAADQAANLERLRRLEPALAEALQGDFAANRVQAWAGVRCASADRRPLVGELQPGLWVSTALGSRGLSFARLAAELVAARLHGEPLPLPLRLARALDVQRASRAHADESAAS